MFLFVYVIFLILNFLNLFINFGKLSGINFFKYFFCRFLSFLLPRFKSHHRYARPFDIAQQLSHDLLLFVFSCLFVFFFSSLTLHFSVDDFCPIFKDCFPCHVKCASPSEKNSSSLTMSTYSYHLHFTYESIFFCFYDKNPYLLTHTVHLFH